MPFYPPYQRHHQQPHSFPTRRSSDLSSTAISSRTTSFCATRGRPSPPFGCSILESRSLRPGSARAQRRRSPARDRKSTRLNSSHVEISYAVFCLKKKKEDRLP